MSLDGGYRRCRDIARRHGTTFFLASRLLPADRRRPVHALYALARLADDLVDEPRPGTAPGDELDRLERELGEALAGGGTDPVLRAVAETVRRFAIPVHCFDRFFASMRRDLEPTSFDTWDDLLGYMDGSAAAIGEMLLPVLDPTDRTAAIEPARQLGLAFQLTNFLRDVEEDLDRGRQYLPQHDLRRFGVDLAHRRADDAFRALMRFEVDRCRRLYAGADRGLTLLPRRSRLAIGAARSMYAAILDEIEMLDHDVWGRRVRVPTAKRLRLVAASAARLWR